MLSEERIRKMIRLADYEKGIGSSDLKRTHYWRMDYVRMQILKTILAVFVAFVLGILLSVLYHMDYVMQHVWELPYDTYLWRYCICGGGDSFCDFYCQNCRACI